MTESIYFQLRNHVTWVLSTDRNIRIGDRIVHLFGWHEGNNTCPARGCVVAVSPLQIKLDGNPERVFCPELIHIVKEDDFDGMGLEAN